MQSSIDALRDAMNVTNVAIATLTSTLSAATSNIEKLFVKIGEIKNEYTPRREHDALDHKVEAIAKKLDELANKLAFYAGGLALLALAIPIVMKVFKI